MVKTASKEKDKKVDPAYSKGFSFIEPAEIIGDCIALGMSEDLIKKISSLVKGLSGNHRIALTVWDKNLLTEKQIKELTEEAEETDGLHFSYVTEAELISYERNSYTVVNSIQSSYLDISIVMTLGRKSELIESIKQKLRNMEWTGAECVKAAIALNIV